MNYVDVNSTDAHTIFNGYVINKQKIIMTHISILQCQVFFGVDLELK